MSRNKWRPRGRKQYNSPRSNSGLVSIVTTLIWATVKLIEFLVKRNEYHSPRKYRGYSAEHGYPRVKQQRRRSYRYSRN